MSVILLSLLAGAVSAAPAPSPYAQTPAIPISYSYGGYPRIQADIHWGTPAGQDIATIFDTGSSSYWVYGPNATINDGSQYHFTQGPCNKSVKNFYNWPASSTHTKPVPIPNGGYSYSYGGNGKIISAHTLINDTMSFGSGSAWPALTNNQVALANFTVVTELDDGCKIPESDFDHSILGLAPLSPGLTFPPSFRSNLLRQGKTQSSSFSMWFDKAPSDVKGKFVGTSIFGAVPDKSKYTGELVRVPLDPPSGGYVGYYVALPKVTTTNIHKPGKPQSIKVIDKSVKQCLLDSGTGDVRIPFSQDQINNVTGLIQLRSPYVTAYNGTCASIPASATLNFTFAGSTKGKTVTIAVPIRNFARGEDDQIPGFDTSKYCGLSFSGDEYGDCVFGAPFFTSAFAVFNDDKNQTALAQGGVSTGSLDGFKGLGAVTTILPGQDIPGSV